MPDGWRTRHTAPVMRIVLLCGRDQASGGRWLALGYADERGDWYDMRDKKLDTDGLSHWRDVPDAPASVGNTEH